MQGIYATDRRDVRILAAIPAARPPAPVALRAAAATLFAILISALLAGSAVARPAPESFADLAERLSPSVVNISTTQNVDGPAEQFEFQFPPGSPFEEFFKEFFDRNRPNGQGTPNAPHRRVTSLGSGFIIDAQGLVVTNNHVIADADEITVTLKDGETLPAEVVGKDPKTDLALLRVKPKRDLPALSWGDSAKARVGDWVVAIGNPFGLSGSVTAGIISSRGRDIQAGPYDDFIQTDASINRGNSGGPLFNLDGEVIGVNTAIFSPSGGSVGIGFAIPSSIAQGVITQLAEYGRTRRGWLGVRIQQVTDEIAEGLGLQSAQGALVAGVTDGGPAEEAGIEAGDVILKFDGAEVEEMRVLPRMVAETEVGKEVAVDVWRDGHVRTLGVTLGELEEAEAEMAAVNPEEQPDGDADAMVLGMTLSRITGDMRQRFQLQTDAEGVVVVDVAAGSAASEKRVQPGDVIIEVANEKVSTPEDVAKRIDDVRQQDRNIVVLRIVHQNQPRFVPLRIDGQE